MPGAYAITIHDTLRPQRHYAIAASLITRRRCCQRCAYAKMPRAMILSMLLLLKCRLPCRHAQERARWRAAADKRGGGVIDYYTMPMREVRVCCDMRQQTAAACRAARVGRRTHTRYTLQQWQRERSADDIRAACERVTLPRLRYAIDAMRRI